MTETSTWQPARPSGSNSSSNPGEGGADSVNAQVRAGARGAMVAALLVPLRGLAPRRRVATFDGDHVGLWRADPAPLAVLWDRTRDSAAAELARELPDDAGRVDRVLRWAVVAACWAYGVAVRLALAAVGYALAWVAAEPRRFAPVALLAVWAWWSWGEAGAETAGMVVAPW